MHHEQNHQDELKVRNKEKKDESEKSKSESLGELRTETTRAMPELSKSYRIEQDEVKALRSQSLDEQIRTTGKARIGPISKHFQCSMEITSGERILVPGRSENDIVNAFKQMKDATERGLMIGAGGAFVQKETPSFPDNTLTQDHMPQQDNWKLWIAPSSFRIQQRLQQV